MLKVVFNMGLEDIKEQALERWAQLKEQLDENPAYNTLKEKYGNQLLNNIRVHIYYSRANCHNTVRMWHHIH